MGAKLRILLSFLAVALCFHTSSSQRLIQTLQNEGWYYNEAVFAEIVANVYGDSILAKLIESDLAKGRIILFFNSSGKIENVEMNVSSGDGLFVLPNNSYAKFRIRYLFEQQTKLYDYTIEPDCYYLNERQYPCRITITPFNNLMFGYYNKSPMMKSPLQYIKTEIEKYKHMRIEPLKEHILKLLDSKESTLSDVMRERMSAKLKQLE